MQDFTNAYREKMLDESQTHRLTGSLDDHAFTGHDVKSVTCSGICSNQDVKIGSAAVSKLTLTFLTPILPRGEWEGKVIKIWDGTLIGPNTPEDKLIGTFWIGSADWTNIGTVEVTAYDCLNLMDDELDFEQTSGKIFDYLKLIELKTGAVLGMTQAEVEALPNGTKTISPAEDSGMKTYRDLLAKLAQLVGGFGYAKRDGTFAIKPFNNTSVIEIPLNRRKKNAVYSDFTTRFDNLTYTDSETGDQIIIGDPMGSGMDIGENPFLQYGLPEVKNEMAQAIWEVVQDMEYTPFKATLLPSFCVLDLGDVVTFLDDYTGNDSSGAIMSWSWTYGVGLTIQCYGSKPKLKNGKSTAQNEINSIRAKRSENEMVIHTFTNSESYTLADSVFVPVVKMRFTTARPKIVTIHHEILLDTISTEENGFIRCTAHYYLNGELQMRVPVTSWNNDGPHLLPLMYWLDNLTSGTVYEWEVYLEITYGSATIGRGDIIAYLEGQGLVAVNEFDGTIELSDEYEPFIAGFDIVALSDSISLDTQIPQTISLSDSYTAFVAGFEIVGLADNMRLRTAYVQFNIVSEDDDFNIVSEDGLYNIVSEGGYN